MMYIPVLQLTAIERFCPHHNMSVGEQGTGPSVSQTMAQEATIVV